MTPTMHEQLLEKIDRLTHERDQKVGAYLDQEKLKQELAELREAAFDVLHDKGSGWLDMTVYSRLQALLTKGTP